MPRYFFHVHDSIALPDREGTVLPDFDAMRNAAVIASGEAIKELGADFWDTRHWRMDVTDEHGNLLLTLQFSAHMP